jgi:hypothetical protein
MRVAVEATNPLLAKRSTLAIEEFKYAFESWRQTPAISQFPKAQLLHCNA